MRHRYHPPHPCRVFPGQENPDHSENHRVTERRAKDEPPKVRKLTEDLSEFLHEYHPVFAVAPVRTLFTSFQQEGVRIAVLTSSSELPLT